MVGDQAAYPDPLAEALDRVRQAASLLDPESGEAEGVEGVVWEPSGSPPPASAEDQEWSGAAVHAAAATVELSRATEEWSVPRLEVPQPTVRRLPGVHGLAEGAYRLLALVPAAGEASRAGLRAAAEGLRAAIYGAIAGAVWGVLCAVVRLRGALGLPTRGMAALRLRRKARAAARAARRAAARAEAEARVEAAAEPEDEVSDGGEFVGLVPRVARRLGAALALPLVVIGRLDTVALLAAVFAVSGIVVAVALALR